MSGTTPGSRLEVPHPKGISRPPPDAIRLRQGLTPCVQGKGADIACGEGQPLGVPMMAGGPYFGYICCKQALVRQLPGRICGRTIDRDDRVGYTLTLQAREQHIRRSRATSNICTNQGLLVTAATRMNTPNASAPQNQYIDVFLCRSASSPNAFAWAPTPTSPVA